MNFQPIIEPNLSILSESASNIISVAPISMAPFAKQLLVEITYIDSSQLYKSYYIYDTETKTYTVNVSDYLGGDTVVSITSIDVAWSASAGVTFVIVYIDKTESSYLSTTTGNRIAIVENGVLLDSDIINTLSGEVANVGINNIYIDSSASQVVFSSAANNLVNYLDTNDSSDVFLLDISNSTLERVSQITNDDEGSESSNALGFSEVNGVTKVLIETTAPEFSTIDLNESNDLYLVTPSSLENTIDLVTETSTNNSGSVVNGQAIIVSDTIVYVSNSDELVSGDSNHSNDIFIHNIADDTRLRLTSNLDSSLDAYGKVEYYLLGLSEDVSKLMFSSNYETLDTTPDLYQVYLMNTNDNSIEILSQTIDGISGNDASLLGVMDNIGSNYAYQTNATNLLADIPGILITNIVIDAILMSAIIHATDNILLDNLSLLYFKDSVDTGVSTLVENGGISFDQALDFDAVKLSDTTAYTSGIAADDAVDVLRDIVHLDSLTIGSAAWHAADVNNDGIIAADDAVAVLRHIVHLDEIDTFDLVDNTTGNRISTLDTNAIDVGQWTIVANGDVDQSGGFGDGYVVQVDIV
jgi:hypothetical protein